MTSWRASWPESATLPEQNPRVKESYQLSDQQTGGERMTARLLIVDDPEIVREGIRTLISRSRPEWVICGEADDGEHAIEAVKSLQPDAVILDVTLPGMSGLRAASHIANLGLGCRILIFTILIFTMHESEWLFAEIRRAGAQGHVLKSQAARDLIRAIEKLLSGGTFFLR
jgi:DNA-binding NarL/FixJ family response regulator